MARRNDSGSDFSHSITDLMTSIAVIFVLLFVLFVNQNFEEMSQGQRTISELLDKLEEEFGPLKIDVARVPGDPLSIEVTLPLRYQGSFTFLQDQSDLLPKGRELVAEIIPKLLGIVCDEYFFSKMDYVIIEGHSSTEGSDEFNVNLSTQRASKTLLYALGVAPVPEKQCLKDLAAASGRGAWHPRISPETGVEDRSASRRVVFRLRVKSLEQREEEAATELDKTALRVQREDYCIA